MIALLAAALAAPQVVLTFDNGGFNLPLYTARVKSGFAQPSVAQQLASDVARLAPDVRVFSYLPPGPTPGRSSEPYEVVPLRPGCGARSARPEPDDRCACPPGDRCWTALDVNRDPAASTSIFQAATAIRGRVAGPRLEVHVTDLFEEDPSAADNPADADRCVTRESTRKAVEALLAPGTGSLDHVAVGLLTAVVDPPRGPVGGLSSFAEGEGGCWSGRRTRTFGPGPTTDIAMAVVVLGVDTASDDAAVRAFVDGLERQVSTPLTLDLVTVREPAATVEVPPAGVVVGAPVDLTRLPPRSTPCAALAASVTAQAAGQPVAAALAPGPTCEGTGPLRLDDGSVRRAWRRSAGLDPRVDHLDLTADIVLTGDAASVRQAVAALPDANPVADRPLAFWDALAAALRLDAERGVWAPREVRVRLPAVRVTGLDDRPWLLSAGLGALLGLCVLFLTWLVVGRVLAERAYRRHLAAPDPGRPLAAVLAEAQEAARGGLVARVLLSCALALMAGGFGMFVLLWTHGVGSG